MRRSIYIIDRCTQVRRSIYIIDRCIQVRRSIYIIDRCIQVRRSIYIIDRCTEALTFILTFFIAFRIKQINVMQTNCTDYFRDVRPTKVNTLRHNKTNKTYICAVSLNIMILNITKTHPHKFYVFGFHATSVYL